MTVDEIKERLRNHYGIKNEDILFHEVDYGDNKKYLLFRATVGVDWIYVYKFEIFKREFKIEEVDYKRYTFCNIYNTIELSNSTSRRSILGKDEKFASSFVGEKFDCFDDTELKSMV